MAGKFKFNSSQNWFWRVELSDLTLLCWLWLVVFENVKKLKKLRIFHRRYNRSVRRKKERTKKAKNLLCPCLELLSLQNKSLVCFHFSLLFSLVGLVLCSIVCYASDKESSNWFNRSMVSSLGKKDNIIKSDIIGLHFSFGFQLCWGNLRQPVIPTSHLYYFLKQEWSAGYIPTMKPSKLSTVCKPMLPSWKKSKVKD